MSDILTIKGSREGLRLMVDQAAAWPDVVGALRDRLGSSESFFHGASLTVDVGERPLSDEQLDELLALMLDYGLKPEALASASLESRRAARRAGITPRPATKVQSTPTDGEEALLVRRTIRSGQVVRSPGHVVVMGDVNAGSEVIAGGSVIVWGRLRGNVHAGALGDTSATCCALDMQPGLLRIADALARSPEKGRKQGPEQARLEEGQIVVVSWEGPRR